MCLEKITIKSNLKDYSVLFENSDSFINELAELKNAVFVIDENVYGSHKSGCLKNIPQDRTIVLKIGEERKNIGTVCELYEQIMQYAPRKNMTLISIGGGITQDITGFVASSLYRGINWIFVPTTLLAQVDSCIGAKTSLNFKHYKNLIGTFYPPSKIYIYPEFLKTLTRDDFYSGVGEMAKLHLMAGKDDTEKFITDLPMIDERNGAALLQRTQNCLNIKKSYIENDEFDTGKRNMLNYGHCFGHALESSTNFAISHGQAVVVGMIVANMYAVKAGMLSKETENYLFQKVLAPSLVVSVPDFDIQKTVDAMKQDKKNIGTGLALVMLTEGFEMMKITDLSEENAKDVLFEFKNKGKNKRC